MVIIINLKHCVRNNFSTNEGNWQDFESQTRINGPQPVGLEKNFKARWWPRPTRFWKSRTIADWPLCRWFRKKDAAQTDTVHYWLILFITVYNWPKNRLVFLQIERFFQLIKVSVLDSIWRKNFPFQLANKRKDKMNDFSYKSNGYRKPL